MKNLFYTLLCVLVFSSFVFSQELKVQKFDPPIPYSGSSDWGPDYTVSNTEPLGIPSGVYRNSSNILYVAVPDTNIAADKCLVILSSINDGANWNISYMVSPAGVVPKTKMVISGLDSVYCFFLYNSAIYCWNIQSPNINMFTGYTNIRDFDVAASSTGSLYFFFDLNNSNQIRAAGSADGGYTWPWTLYLSSTGAHPRIYMSGTEDILLINYYGVTIQPDTITSAIRSVRYRESAPGTLLIKGTFSTPIAAGIPKDQFMGVLLGNTAWLFYTTGLTGNIDLNCMVSADSGTTFGSPFTIGSLPGRDEYWFDAKHFLAGYGVDLIYYSDTLQSGPPTNITDRLYYSSASINTPTVFDSSVQINQHPLIWSARGYIPSLIEYYNVVGDNGAIWVGVDGANQKLFFDRMQAVTNIKKNTLEIPDNYTLKQNYPNPFNPITKIEFSIPKDEFVSLKVYDLLGKEVYALVSNKLKSGKYIIDFDGSSFSSGVYFYKIAAGIFTETRKMILLK